MATLSSSDSPKAGITVHSKCEFLPFEGQGAKGSKILYARCKLNPGHAEFKTWSQFEELPLPDCVTETDKAYLKIMFDRTVKISVAYTSPNRPDKFRNTGDPYFSLDIKGCKRERVGTGFIDLVCTPDDKSSTSNDSKFPGSTGKCPCPECEKSCEPKMKYWWVTVATATHVIYDDDEASKTVVSVFLDNVDQEDSNNKLYGIKVHDIEDGDGFQKGESDNIQIICVTHDEGLATRVMQVLKESENYSSHRRKWGSLGFIISHPHGMGRRISMGHIDERCCVYAGLYNYNNKGFQLPTLELFGFSLFDDNKKYDWEIEEDRSCSDGDSNDDVSTFNGFDDSDDEDDDDEDRYDDDEDDDGLYVDDHGDDCFGYPMDEDILDEVQRLRLKRGACITWSVNILKPRLHNSIDYFLGRCSSEPEQSFILPKNAIVKIPHGAYYTYKNKLCNMPKCTLPVGCQFVAQDGTYLPLPRERELCFSSEDDIHSREKQEIEMRNYFTYSIATCPGSSGARLICSTDVGDEKWNLDTRHFGRGGSDHVHSDTNLSGLSRRSVRS